MEDLTEQIAAEIGPKWVQLLSRLQLDYRERYKLCAKHKDAAKPLLEANCTRDTIRLWQESLGNVPEREMMTQLLAAFRTVKGFDDRAKDLAQSLGISLHLPEPATTSSQESGTTSKSTTETAHSSHTPPPIPNPIPDTQSRPLPATPDQTSTIKTDAKSDVGDSDVDSSHSFPLHPFKTQEQQLPKFRTHSPTLSSSSERLDDHLLSSTIDVSVVKHKYALLDVCQRLPASAMTDFSQRLGLPLEKVRQITSDFTMQEERYYQALKYWLEAGGGEVKRTFGDLRGALESCQQQTASDVVLRRLQSSGLTLRSPAM